MRWFKHMSCANTDEKLSRLVDAYGLEGYGFYWLMLEKVSALLDDTGTPEATYSIKRWCAVLGIHALTFKKLLQICVKLGLFKCEIVGGLTEDCSEFAQSLQKLEPKNEASLITVKIPNLLKYRDEWARKKCKNSGVTTEKLRSKDTDTDTEKDINNTPHTPQGGRGGEPSQAASTNQPDDPPKQKEAVQLHDAAKQDFDLFWDAYPNKKNKRTAFKKWGKLQKDKQLPRIEKILSAIDAAKKTLQWTKDDGQYIPLPSTWLNEHRWEDELKIISTSKPMYLQGVWM